jgi:hypothetical protein
MVRFMVLNRSVSDRDSGPARAARRPRPRRLRKYDVARNPQLYLKRLIGDTGPCEYSSSTVKPHISTPAFCGREVWRTGTPVEPPRAWPLGCRSVLGLVRHTTLKDLSASSMVSCSHQRRAHISPTYNERIARSPPARGHRAATGQATGAGDALGKRREPTTRPWWLFTCVASASMGSGTSCATPPSRRF